MITSHMTSHMGSHMTSHMGSPAHTLLDENGVVEKCEFRGETPREPTVKDLQ